MFSNQTPNYGLPQYEQNDTLNVLSDFNGAMETIDSTMKTNELAAASAQSKADGADTKANNNATAIGDLQTAQGADRTDINTLTGAVNTINSLIGNGTPTTTDKTLIGAINELNTHFNSGYKMVGIETVAEVTGDGVKTAGALLAELHAALIANCALLGNDRIDVHDLAFSDFGLFRSHNSTYFLNSSTNSFDDYFDYSNVYADGFTIARIHLASTPDAYNYGAVSGGTPTYFNYSNEIIPDGYKITITGIRYTPV